MSQISFPNFKRFSSHHDGYPTVILNVKKVTFASILLNNTLHKLNCLISY